MIFIYLTSQVSTTALGTPSRLISKTVFFIVGAMLWELNRFVQAVTLWYLSLSQKPKERKWRALQLNLVLRVYFQACDESR